MPSKRLPSCLFAMANLISSRRARQSYQQYFCAKLKHNNKETEMRAGRIFCQASGGDKITALAVDQGTLTAKAGVL